jgi:hypothetical protein
MGAHSASAYCVSVDGSLAVAGHGYLDHLTDADLELLARVADLAGGARRLRREPAVVPRALDRPEVHSALFGPAATASGRLVSVSPFLAFAVAVHRAATALAAASYVPERAGPGQRVPVFDAAQLSDFLQAPLRRLFLAELLASFARVASGSYWIHTDRGWRPKRFSELDPVRLAGLAQAVPEAERPRVYPRLGDVTLFLAGVFPDYVRARALGPIDAARLLRVARIATEHRERLTHAPAIELFEHLGAAWYRRAGDLVPVRSAQLAVVAEVADRFRQARRVLNHIADRDLFPAGNPWFSSP